MRARIHRCAKQIRRKGREWKRPLRTAPTMTHSARPAARHDPVAQLLDRLRSGDERAFMMLVQRYRPSMIRLAAGYVPSQAVAEEVVQEAWLGSLNGISRFEGRSSVRTWLFRILANRARTTGMRERRTTAVGDLTPPETGRRRRSRGPTSWKIVWSRRRWLKPSGRQWQTCRCGSEKW